MSCCWFEKKYTIQDQNADYDLHKVKLLAQGECNVQNSYRIQEFDPDGHPKSNWGWHLFWLVPRPNGAQHGFNVPTGVSFGPDGEYIHVADSANSRVVMLDSNGAFVTDWTIEEKGSGYHTPVTVATSPDGKRLYVTDIANQRIIVLGIERSKEKENE